MTDPSPSRRRALAALATLAGVPLISSCGTPPAPRTHRRPDAAPTDTTPEPAPSSTAPPSPTIPPVTVESNVDDRATGVTVDTILELSVSNGTLTSVEPTATVEDRESGKPVTVTVPGTLAEDGSSWRATDGLDPGVEYTVTIGATNASEDPVTLVRTFTTHELTLDQQTFPAVYPLDGMTMGVAMPAVVRFDIPVTDKANVEKHLHIDVSPKQPGSWYWLNDSEVHYRPKAYWKPGTKVTVDARLNGVKAGKDLYGQESRTFSFQIARRVVAKVDLAEHVLKVYIGDKLARTIEISAGKKGFTTRSGVKVISEKLETTPMRSETDNINDPDYYDLEAVKWAMRLTQSGEFFHAAPWNAPYFGRANVSHGCTGMSNADAKWLFENMRVGDPAEFTGSKRGMEPGNGWTDWNLSWSEVRKRSAL